MQAIIFDVDGQPAVGDNQHDQWCNVRRLSTPSFTEKKTMVDSYLTQWRWYWKDEIKKWNMYNTDVFLFTLERKYQTKQKTYLYTRENYFCMYMIDFLKMIEIDLETDRKQNITRRPLFVSKDDVNEKKFPDSIQFPAAMNTVKPVHFYHWDCAHDFELVELDTKGKEFNEVLKSLQDSMSPTLLFETKFIFRIQNRKLWSEYDIKKKLILADAEKDGRDQNINERDLFHGTDSLDTCRGICTNNFDFRTSGRNGTLYGEGSYFAVHAKISHSYTKADLPTDIRFMFRAKVLVGQFTTGNPSLRRPPEIT
ncbi:PARP7S [Mytilus coruscus]|uniref:Poly [ADP-ribose] polymerase n=1 Tax=Mytilus coruscus TaxID=42192 RepID=A0A6J8CXJ7_MYTCO|nr:PARP7S [Mytilus coruscus]